MARAVLSTAVRIKAAPTQAQRLAAALTGQSLTAHLPTETEVRSAVAQAVRDMEDLRLARRPGWDPAEAPSFQVFTTAEGEVGVRLTLIVERAD